MDAGTQAQDARSAAAQPENIFVCGEDDEAIYKLGDLGLVKLNSDTRDVIEGDSRYLPRELLLEDFSALAAADIFSLGATTLEMAIGETLPGEGPDWQALRDGKLPLEKLAEDNEQLKSVIVWMMHPSPSERPSAADLLRHPLFRSEVETLLHQERLLASGLQEKLTQVLNKGGGPASIKRTMTM